MYIIIYIYIYVYKRNLLYWGNALSVIRYDLGRVRLQPGRDGGWVGWVGVDWGEVCIYILVVKYGGYWG